MTCRMLAFLVLNGVLAMRGLDAADPAPLPMPAAPAAQPAAAAPAPATTPAPLPAPRNVIIISWDGCDRSVIWDYLARQRLPNLTALIHDGSLQTIDVKGHVTVTKPGHAEMLTGLDCEHTRVHSNNNYQPIPEGYTIFERVQAALGGKDRIHTFMVTGKLAHVGGRGPDEIKAGEANRKKRAAEAADQELPEGADNTAEAENQHPDQGEPFFLTRKALDVFDAAQRNADEVGPLCLKYLAQYRDPRFLAFLHFSDPDHAGHRFGAASQEYRQAAVTCDAWLGKIVAWLKEQKLYDQTLIYVMTDHGFDMPAGHSHSEAPNSWLATNDPAVTHGGIIADVPATVLAHFGVDLAKLDPPLIGHPLTGPAPVEPAAPAVEKPRRAGKAREGKQGKEGKAGRAGKEGKRPKAAEPAAAPTATL